MLQNVSMSIQVFWIIMLALFQLLLYVHNVNYANVQIYFEISTFFMP